MLNLKTTKSAHCSRLQFLHFLEGAKLAKTTAIMEVTVHSDHRNRGYSLFLLLVHPQPRPVHSRWLVPLCEMGFRCRKDCSPGFFLTHSTLASKLFFLAVQGSGALLSSNLEGALYRSP